MSPPETAWAAHGLYACAWATFGLGHSLLASPAAKQKAARVFGAGVRLAYNIFAALHIAAVLVVGHWLLGDRAGWTDAAAGLAAVHIAGWGLLLLALKDYDLGRFAGTAQLRRARAGHAIDEDEPLVLGGLHRYVRHPLYSGAFLILWGGAVNPLGLATAVWGSVYLLVGTGFEERKLLRLHGNAYARYRARVPAYLPWRGRAWGGSTP